LTDFGLSIEKTDDLYDLTEYVGSFAYLAPEVIKEEPHGKSIDFYGLGTVLYEMLAGIPPYY
jgi:serine/threonine protein kinase